MEFEWSDDDTATFGRQFRANREQTSPDLNPDMRDGIAVLMLLQDLLIAMYSHDYEKD